MAACLWANYQLAQTYWAPAFGQPSALAPESGFVYVGTSFNTGEGTTVYTITAIAPATPYQAGGGGANPLPPTSINSWDTITITPAIGGVSTFPTSILAGMIRVCG